MQRQQVTTTTTLRISTDDLEKNYWQKNEIYYKYILRLFSYSNKNEQLENNRTVYAEGCLEHKSAVSNCAE